MSVVDARELGDGERLTADLCVVGAGPAGITVAREVAARGGDVVLLEGGGFDIDPQMQQLYAGSQSGREYRPLDMDRIRAFGGSTNHWEGYCRPLDERDFDPPPGLDVGAWPFGAAELADHYRAAAVACEIDPELRLDAATWADPAGMALLPTRPEGLGNEVLLRSPPTNFGHRYRDEVVEDDRIRLVHHANVVHLEQTGSTIRELVVKHFDGRTQTVAADRVVVATGGIEVPRLLLSSPGRTGHGVGNDQDLVGRFFMEHVHLSGFAVMAHEHPHLEFYVDEADVDGQVVRGILTIPREFREQARVGNAAVVVRQLWPGTGGDHEAGVGALMATLTGQPPQGRFGLQLLTEQIPWRGSRVRLSDRRDALGMRRAHLHWELHDYDWHTLRRVSEFVGAELAQAGVGRLRSPLHAPPRKLLVRGGSHHMGTARMHEDPARGVVDADARVHGTDNLWIAGSAVFPTGGFANPTLTLVALARRLGVHLAETT